MNILVIGAGAIGCLVGGRLALTDAENPYIPSQETVTLVGRPHFVLAVQRQKGLQIEQGGRTERIHTLRVAGSVQQAFQERSQDFDAVILTVKSYDTEAALHELTRSLQSHGHKTPLLLTLQNGVGNEEVAAGALDPAHVVAGVITTPVSVLAPGSVRVEKAQFNLGISPWHPAVPQKPFEALRSALHGAGFDVVVYPQPRSLKWTKLLMNMIGNASSAILNITPAQVFANPQLVDLELDAWRETLAVMQASGMAPVNIGSYPFTILAPLIRRLPRAILRPMLRGQIGGARGDKMPSLHISLHNPDPNRQTRSEIDWLNGAVVRQGERVKIPTPINRMLVDTLHQLVRHPQQQAVWEGEALRMVVTADEYRSRERSAQRG